jgi:4-amino-4-deoxy-L-arabinose transferase-like glycosyltransferase
MINLNIRDGQILAAIVALAILLRWIFFTGYFGSDEVTYTAQALAITKGVWPISEYIGSIRYGVNIPVAFFMALLGPSEFSANLWSFLCSIGEIIVVYLFARQLWGVRAAWLAALLLAFLPLHVHYAGRLMADSPLAFFITLSFYFFWLAEQQRRILWYVLAGVSAGLVFWVKESVFPVYLLVFGLYAIVSWRWNWRWLLVAGSALAVLAANSLLMAWITGDPLHVFHVIQKNMQTPNPVLSPTRGRSPDYYFKYLFIDIKHTWLLAYIALGGLILIVKNWGGAKRDWNSGAYVALWSIGLVLVFSFMVVSGKPLRFIPKQTNYMLIFVAPLAMLGGYFLSRLGKKVSWAIVGMYIFGGVALSAFEQQVIHAFTANSKATFAFAQANQDAEIYGSTNAVRTAHYAKLFAENANAVHDIYHLSMLEDRLAARASSTGSPVHQAYAVIDTGTIGWGKSESMDLLKIPACWQRREELKPIGFGSGRYVTDWIRNLASAVPGPIGERLANKLEDTFVPKPTYVYSVPHDC